MWKIDIQRLDYDDYPIGNPISTVGPFRDYDDAEAFLDSVHPMILGGKRLGLFGYTAIIGEVRYTKPEDYKQRNSV